MRIIAGLYRSRRIAAPRGLDVRPTSDRARESLFNVLAPALPGAAFLDLFAGTGAVGLEALSRQAAAVVFCERDPRALAVLGENIAALDATDRTRVIRGDWLRALFLLAREEASFDVVFADPPYDTGLAAGCLLSPATDAILRPGGLLVIEHRRTTVLPSPPPDLPELRRLPAGEAVFSIHRKEGGA
jgi:16S rRNA (guanine966-N2)-methyltransferase